MKLQMQDRASFYTTTALGKTRSVTPEGFLLCQGVPIGRIGTQIYSKDELELKGDSAGQIRVTRLPEEVFRPETMASFEGKPVTVEHPNEFVNPRNWSFVSVGTVHNVRRGTADEKDLLIADLLIKSADAIAYVNSELPEVSSGYEANYEQDAPGVATQRNIIGNHVALVTRGRAGHRCAIKDAALPFGDLPVKKRSLFDRITTAFKAQDMEAVRAELAEIDSPSAQTTDAANPLEQRVIAIETGLAEIKTLITADAQKKSEEQAAATAAAEAQKTADAPFAISGDALKEVVSRAEILAPGIQIPTGDALKEASTIKALMQNALEKANADEKTRPHVATFAMGREIKALTADALIGAFTGAAELTRVRNNQEAARGATGTKDSAKPLTPADVNKRNQDFWAKH